MADAVVAIESSGFDSSSDEENKSTSTLTPFKLDWIALSMIGINTSLAISNLPGCKFKNVWRNLKMDIDAIQSAGIESVYVLLTKGEMKKYRVPSLLEEYESRSIIVHHYPFLDGTAPSIDLTMQFISDLKRDLDKRHKTLIHCFGGFGRSCLLAACFMMHLDDTLTADHVIDLFRFVRGAAAIQTVKQYNFVHDFRNLRDDSLGSTDDARCLSR